MPQEQQLHPELKEGWSEIAHAVHECVDQERNVGPETKRLLVKLSVGEPYTPALLAVGFGEKLGLSRGLCVKLAAASALVGRGRFLAANNNGDANKLLASDAFLTRGLAYPSEWTEVDSSLRLRVAKRLAGGEGAHRSVAESLLELSPLPADPTVSGPLRSLAESMDRVARSNFEGAFMGIGQEDRGMVLKNLITKWKTKA